jgi:hypothetical protein
MPVCGRWLKRFIPNHIDTYGTDMTYTTAFDTKAFQYGITASLDEVLHRTIHGIAACIVGTRIINQRVDKHVYPFMAFALFALPIALYTATLTAWRMHQQAQPTTHHYPDLYQEWLDETLAVLTLEDDNDQPNAPLVKHDPTRTSVINDVVVNTGNSLELNRRNTQELRELCTRHGIVWRNARGKGKHLLKQQMIDALWSKRHDIDMEPRRDTSSSRYSQVTDTDFVTTPTGHRVSIA